MPAFITPLSSDNVTVNESAARKLVEHELSLGQTVFISAARPVKGWSCKRKNVKDYVKL